MLVLGLWMACTSESAIAPAAQEGEAPSGAPAAPPEELGDAPPATPDDTGWLGDTADPDVDDGPPLGWSILYGDGTVLSFAITLDTAARASLALDPYSEVPATFMYRGETWRVGLRLKGSRSFRTFDGKPAFRVDFNEYVEGGDFFGVKHVTLNNMVQDETMLHEDAYYWMCRQVGIPAPRHGYAWVVVNGEPYGLYSLVEAMDDQYIAYQWPDDRGGALYEASGADFTETKDWFDVDEEGEGDIDRLVDQLAGGPGSDWLGELEEHFDTRELFAYWAMDIVTGNDDGYVFNNHNYHVYYAPSEGRWHVIPWGVDRTFEREHVPPHGDPLLRPYSGYLATTCLQDADCTAALDDAIVEMTHAWEDHDLAGRIQRTKALIEPYAETDPRAEESWQYWEIEDFVDEAPSWVRSQLD